MSEKPTYEELKKRVQELEQAESERERTAQALRESEARFRLLYERAPLGYQSLDERGCFIQINQAWLDTLGYTREEVIGKSFGDFLHPDWAEHFKENFPRFKAVGEVLGVEFEMMKKDGTTLLVSFNGKIGRDAAGNFQQTHCILHDITDRKWSDEKQKKLQAQLSNAMEIAQLGHWEYDVANDRFIFSDQFYKIFRTTANQVGGYTMSSAEYAQRFVHPDDRSMVGEEVRKAIETTDPCFNRQLEHRILFADGTVGYITVRFFVVKDVHGKTVRTYGVNQDITGRKRAEEALRESEKRFRDLAEMLPEAVFETDKNMKLTFVNRQAYLMFGYSQKDFNNGLNCFDMIVDEGTNRARENAIKRFHGEESGVQEYRALRKDGSTFPVFFHTTPILNRGTVVGFRGIIVDITEQKKIEEQLRHAQRIESIGTLAGGIAHDFNNILFPIVGLSEMLMDDLSAANLNYENAAEIKKAGMRAKDLVKQILAFSRQAINEKVPVKIQHILKEVLKLTRSTIPSNIEITHSIQSDCPLVMADPTQVHQIAMNLVTNAYHAVEKSGGSISIQLKELVLTGKDWAGAALEPGKYAAITVSDKGHGIDPAIRGKIFEPYFTTKEVGKGTGLGLSVVHGIVKDHGGDIHVYSEPGEGTAFTVYLPLMKKALEAVTPENVIIHETGTERILLVDDEELIVRLEQLMLERLGYHITTRMSSLDALDAFRANPDAFDLVITDMTMPNMTGDQLAKELNLVKPGIPIILCTGFSTKIDEQSAKANGINGFLMKPVVKSDMAHMIRKVLDEAKG